MKVLPFRTLSGKLPTKEFKINFDIKHLEASFKNIPFARLLLANLVLKACQMPFITSKLAPFYVKYALKYPSLFTPINPIVRGTFFKHFCGGTELGEISQCAKRLSSLGVGSILDPAMEEDLHEVSSYPKDRVLAQLANSPSSIFNASTMSRRKIQIEKCINTAEFSAKENKNSATTFIALKLTCMVPTGLLYMFTSSLDYLIGELEKFPNLSTKEKFETIHRQLKHDRSFSTLELIKTELSSCFLKFPNLSSRNLVFSLKPETVLNFYLDVYLPSQGHQDSLSADTKSLLYDSLLKSIEYSKQVLEYAARRSISIMVDAEQTYFQTAIHYLTFNLIKDSDVLRKEPFVYGTYQMYLKSGFAHLKEDSLLYSKYGLPFALKIVRGAYIQSESARSETLASTSPINDSMEMTHEQYSAGIEHLLCSIDGKENYPKVAAAFFATHNIDSVEKILTWITRHPSPETLRNKVMIGQLLGMGDHLTLTIANSKLASAYKYVPVGTLQEVLPYLLRRSQENSSLFGRASLERQQLKQVLIEKLKFPVKSVSVKGGPSAPSMQ